MKKRLYLIVVLVAVLLYSVFEEIRFLVLKTELTEASHRAAVFGASSGSDAAHYTECTLIRDAALSVRHFSKITDQDILLEHGNTDGLYFEYCLPGTNIDESPSLSNGDRLKITVFGEYKPLFFPIFRKTVAGKTVRTIILPIKIIEQP